MPSSFFSFTGADQSFVVPFGVTSIFVSVLSGGSAPDDVLANFTSKGRVTGDMPVTPGESLTVRVGGPPTATTGGTSWVGGWPDGGNGVVEGGGFGGLSCGGAGSSSILRAATRKVVAGATGGGSPFSGNVALDQNIGGDGGDPNGYDGGPFSDPNSASLGGRGATTGGVGAGGVSSSASNGAPGSGGTGGDGAHVFITYDFGFGPETFDIAGGGGGGGYFGGGGGGVDADGYDSGGSHWFPAGGGGGGSSFADGDLTSVSMSRDPERGNGNIGISWVTPPFRGQVHILDG